MMFVLSPWTSLNKFAHKQLTETACSSAVATCALESENDLVGKTSGPDVAHRSNVWQPCITQYF